MQTIMNDNKKNKGEILYNITKNNNYIKNKIIILALLEEKKLYNIIKDITDSEVTVSGSAFLKQDKISEYDNFIYFLDSFITYVMRIINNYSIIDNVIIECLKNKESNILLEKIYPYDDNNISRIKYNYELMIISNLYYNLKEFSNELSGRYNILKLDINNIDITNADDIDKLINLLEELCFINKDNYYLLSLFTKVKEDNYDMYLSYYERLLDNYIDNINFIKEYQLFKKNNNIYL